MTAEQKVKEVYPEAVVATLADNASGRGAWWYVYSDPAMGKTMLLARSRRERWAWVEAWRRIELERRTDKIDSLHREMIERLGRQYREAKGADNAS